MILAFVHAGFVAAQPSGDENPVSWGIPTQSTMPLFDFESGPNGESVVGSTTITLEDSAGWEAPADWVAIDRGSFTQAAAINRVPASEHEPGVQVSSTGIETAPTWIVDADFLALVRNDEHHISFNAVGGPRTVPMQSDSVAGVRLSVSRGDGPASFRSQTEIWEGVFQFANDENSYSIASEEWFVKTRLLTAELNGGMESEVFGVRTQMLVGARYVGLADQYDRESSFSVHSNGRLVTTGNHAGYAQGKMGLQWQRDRWSISALLAGGVGLNAAHQEGTVFGASTVSEYEVDQISLSTLAEGLATVNFRLFARTQIQCGLYGLSVSEMAAARRSLGGEGNLDDVNYFGLTIGVQRWF